VTIDELITAYSTDAEAAGATYKGKTITVSGKVAGINATDFSVTLVGDSTADSGDVTCVFGSTDSSTISNLELDQAIKAKGTVGDFAGGSVEITNCSFVN